MPKKPLTDKDGDVRALGTSDVQAMKRLKDAHPEMVDTFKRMRGRPRIGRPKRQWTLRLDAGLIKAIKDSGRDYTSRVEQVLRDAIADGRL